ncbi:MAG: dethiobiotin synthase [Caulobacteraceae bacterium]|nr:dethiobiotin synthase [Caulobacteraceae bacterium]
MNALFMAGAGTDVGKTFVAAQLIRALIGRGVVVEALKPVVSGFDPGDWALSDPGQLLAALGRPLDAETLQAISPWRYAAPLSPDMAARLEGRAVDCAAVAAFCRSRIAARPEALTLVEGAGGVMSPVDEDTTGLDLMAGIGAPVVVVGGSYLGAISHTLTAIEAVRARGLTLKAVVVSESQAAGTPFAETVAAVARLGRASPVIAAPRQAGDLAWREALAEAVLRPG